VQDFTSRFRGNAQTGRHLDVAAIVGRGAEGDWRELRLGRSGCRGGTARCLPG
jgi:hypothetical protein